MLPFGGYWTGRELYHCLCSCLWLGLGPVLVPKVDGKGEWFFSDPVGRCSPLASGLLTLEAVLPASVLLLSPLLLQGDVRVCLGPHTCFQAL